MKTPLRLAVTIDMIDPESGERWTRSRAYDVPRGLHIGRLLEEMDAGVQDAKRIVTRKQKARLDAELSRIQEKISHAETERAEAKGEPVDLTREAAIE